MVGGMSAMTPYQPSQAALVPYADMERMATTIAQSGLFGVKSPVQALALMLIAQAEGLHPATAARDYHVIQGRPALKADSMLARFQAAGGKVEWHAYEDTAVSGTFSHPSGGKVRIEWTIDQAKRAGLTGKDVWKQYPRAMLRARVISEGIRTVYPGVLSGMYTPEEVRDFDAAPAGPVTDEPVAVEPARVAVQPPAAPEFDLGEADDIIAGFRDKTKMRAWLKDIKLQNNWPNSHPVYSSLKAACAERAKAIDDEAAKVQSADEFAAEYAEESNNGE